MLLDLHECLQSFTHVVSEMVAIALYVGKESLVPHDGHFKLFLIIFVGVALSLELAEELNEGRDYNCWQGVFLGQHSFEEESRPNSIGHLSEFHTSGCGI